MSSTGNPSFQRTLDAVLPRLQDAVRLMDTNSAAIAAYQFGWTDEQGQPVDTSGGKWLRPSLALLSAQAAGADAEVGVPGAVAVELIHNFSLIHDDVMDRDAERRHRPTVWAVWGVPSAILTGDAMVVAAQRTLLDGGSAYTTNAMRLLLEATRELIGGQALDLEFESRTDVSLADCQAMAAGKTGALIAASAAIGAVLAGAPQAVVDDLHRYGSHVGAAFQLVDDLLGIWGDPEVTGKPVLADLRARKMSLPVTYAISKGDDVGQRLAERLTASDNADEAELAETARLVEAAGGRRWAEEEAVHQAGLAKRAIAGIDMAPEIEASLRDLAEFVATRRH